MQYNDQYEYLHLNNRSNHAIVFAIIHEQCVYSEYIECRVYI